ncbi:cytochrome c oxidase subunit II [Actinomycetospora straminea]|uniref:aa3-type cytochrome oxidase subunit II n=1 Tax=Actinomycetospora straminea TaxID=663607 RepID=UPI002365562A|nr:cytochrome c oxidase subunit II [Actinomycetospora straminea]MDD7932953.1 cytochrome c oxidase subunit II [Actinomycetospora straminea]
MGLALAAVAVAVTTSGCSVDEVLRFGWPVGVTPEATQMRTLWTWSAVAALVVGVLVWGATAWTVAFHRRRAGASDLPRQFQYNLPLELVLTVIPLIIVAVLFYFTVVVQNVVDRNAQGNELQIQVTGFQWNWEFTYPQTPGPNGLPASVVGTTESVPILVLPTDRPIQFTQESKDVIHSFWVPEFLFKRDVIPDPAANDQKNTWVIDRIERPGAFVGRCAEFCGAYHSMMNFEVRALPPAQFDQFLQLRTQINPQTGQGFTTNEALATLNCGELCNPESITTRVINPDPTAQLAVR